MEVPSDRRDIVALTTDIVANYVRKNAVPLTDLPALIRSVAGTLQDLDLHKAAASARL